MLRERRIISSDRDCRRNLTDTSRPIVADIGRPIAADNFDDSFDAIGNRLNSSGSAEMAQALLASAGPNGRVPLGRTFGNLVAIYNAASSNALLKTHTRGLDLSGSLQGAGGVGGLISVKEHSGTHAGTYHFAYDANGNVSEVLKKNPGSLVAGAKTLTHDADSNLAAHYEYDPFGNTIRSTGAYAAANPFRFSTKYRDAETALYYYGFRHYDPATGRWPSRDPLEEFGVLNLYAFIGNNGANAWDYLGWCSQESTSESVIVNSPNGDSITIDYNYTTDCSNGSPSLDFNSEDYSVDYPWNYNQSLSFGVIFITTVEQYTRDEFDPGDPTVTTCSNDPNGEEKEWNYVIRGYSGKRLVTGAYPGIGIDPWTFNFGDEFYEFDSNDVLNEPNEIVLFEHTITINKSCCCCPSS